MTPEDVERIKRIFRDEISELATVEEANGIRISRLEETVQTLLDVLQNKTTAKTDERPDDLVDVAYVARRLSLSEYTVRAGKAATDAIPRHSSRLIRFQRGDVDEFIRSRTEEKTPAQRGLKLLERKGSRVRRRSVVLKSKAGQDNWVT